MRMRLMGAFLFFFLFVIISGTISFMYLMWTNYWIRIRAMETHYINSRAANRPKNQRRRPHYDTPEEIQTEAAVGYDQPPDKRRPKFYNNGEAVVSKKISLAALPKDKLLAHLELYKRQIRQQLRNTVTDAGKQVKMDTFPNAYNVTYSGKLGPRFNKMSVSELLCSARANVNINTFTNNNAMFKKLKLDRFFPRNEFLENRSFNTCAVVTSAGSLKHSKLGSFVDSHDIVMRFNDAPTQGHSKDVGKKTNIRIVNSQVVAKPRFKFLESKIYSKAAVLVWDPSAYNGSHEEWYNKPDWPFFEQFFSRRLMQPDDPLYLLNPDSMWSLWNWLQSVTPVPLLPTPPSSGFLGILLLLNHCHLVHVFEYIPSMRLTKRCHYYDEEENLGCTLGDWHPLAAEKLLALSLHTGSDMDLFHKGILTIPGFSTCSNINK